MKKKLLICSVAIGMMCCSLFPVFAAENATNDFEIIPKATTTGVSEAVSDVGSEGGKVREHYNEQANTLTSVGDQMASGIMTRDTLLDYIVYLVRFLSQIGIVIGVVMIIYAGYMYATSIFSSSNMAKGKSALTNAIIGVIVIAFSYAIMKLLTSAFLS